MTTNDLSDLFSPHTGSDRPLSLGEKIDFFVNRTQRLQIQPAIEMQSQDIPNRGFAPRISGARNQVGHEQYISGYRRISETIIVWRTTNLSKIANSGA